MKKNTRLLFAVGFVLLLVCPALAESASKPNILLILTDDLGFSDIGCYGSEIETPTLDRLAENGLRFSQFYNTAKCHSSRVSLLSGRWCLQAGNTSLSRAVTVAEVLGKGGYFTAMTGKWHLKKEPTDFGFQRYFGHLSGACNYYLGDNTFRLNGEPWKVPKGDFYTTVADVDFALDFLDEAREEKKPWFLYVAFNAPHAPLQPLETDYRRYEGKYRKGWDKIRSERLAKQNKLNLFGKKVKAGPRPDHVMAWEKLPPEISAFEGRRMAAYAALIDRVDQEIGRLIANLEENQEMENTLILFFSDNGACPYDRSRVGIDREPFEPTTKWSDSTGWAWVRNSPFRYYKQNQFEGGIATPAIIHWPAGLKTKPGSLIHTPAHIVDVLPTLAEIAGVEIPDTWPDREPTPLAGISLAPIFAGRSLSSRPPIHLLFGTDRGLRDGDWKLVSFRRQPWELYNIAQDRTEQNNIAAQHPEITKRMIAQWHDMTENVLLAPKNANTPVLETATGHQHPEWTDFSATTVRPIGKKPTKKTKAAASKGGNNKKDIRARKDTKMEVVGGQLVLQCQDGDPGLAFASLGAMDDQGPYTLEFRIQSRAGGEGEVYWTSDPQTILPKGARLAFRVEHDGQWHSIALKIPETKRLYQLRLDPCEAKGEVRIEGLKLKDAAGKIVKAWP